MKWAGWCDFSSRIKLPRKSSAANRNSPYPQFIQVEINTHAGSRRKKQRSDNEDLAEVQGLSSRLSCISATPAGVEHSRFLLLLQTFNPCRGCLFGHPHRPRVSPAVIDIQALRAWTSHFSLSTLRSSLSWFLPSDTI